MKAKYTYFMAAALLLLCVCAAAATSPQTNMKPANDNPKGVKVLMQTSLGDITLLLYDDTPQHRDNMIKLINEGYYDGVLFHRVIKDFMVQSGDPDSKDAKPGQQLGSGSPDYTIEAEFRYPEHFHKRGALAAARTADQFNPERRSSSSQFYIVTGTKWDDAQLEQMEKRMEYNLKEEYFRSLVQKNREEIERLAKAEDKAALDSLQKKLVMQTEEECPVATIPQHVKDAYKSVGGTPHLDDQYTVFGEVLDGMDVIDKIQEAETDPNDRPKEDIRILKIRLLK